MFRPRHALAATLFAVAATPSAGPARADTTQCTPITSLPAVISQGGVYCLAQDLATNIESGSAITINASNVTLDCNERKLGGLAAGDDTWATGIASHGRSNISIRNCNIRGFYHGIALVGPLEANGGHLVEDNRLDGNTYTGILVVGDGSIIRRNRITDTGGAVYGGGWTMGINTTGSVEVTDNLIHGMHNAQDRNDAYGMMLGANYNGSVTGNRITGTVAELRLGIRILSGDRVRIMDNYVGQGSGWIFYCDTPANGWTRGNQWHSGGGNACVDAGANVVVP